MKHVLTAAALAALLMAVPASAQTAFGAATGDNAVAAGTPGGNWKGNFLVYAEAPDSILLDKLTAPLGDAGASSVGTGSGVTFAVTAASANLSGFGGVGTNAVNPVPEPATWAMMLVGFGAVGGTLRSRRTATLRYA